MDKIVVELRKREILRVSKKTTTMISEPLKNEDAASDPHVLRIERIDAPVLRNRGFVPVNGSMDQWEGKFRRYRCTIYFPPLYPAHPFEFYWKRTPRGFHNVVEKNRLCVEALLDDEKWSPAITVETILEALETHEYFTRK